VEEPLERDRTNSGMFLLLDTLILQGTVKWAGVCAAR